VPGVRFGSFLRFALQQAFDESFSLKLCSIQVRVRWRRARIEVRSASTGGLPQQAVSGSFRFARVGKPARQVQRKVDTRYNVAEREELGSIQL
jgi:hypothetical protein